MFLERFTNYLQYEKRFSEHTVNAYRTDLLQFQEYLSLSQLSFAEATHPHIRSWIVEMMDEERNASSISRKLSTLRSFYKFLVREKLMPVNPTLLVRAPKLAKRLPVIVDDSSISALLDSLELNDSFEQLRDRLVFEMLFGTGIRLAELLGIEESDFDAYRQEIRIIGKRSKERIVPVNASLNRAMMVYLKRKKTIFSDNLSPKLIVTSEGRSAYPKLIYRIVKKYLTLISTSKKKSPHVLRHSFATCLLNKGADLNAIKELLGHASLAATQVYTHNSVERLKTIYKQAHPKA